MSLCRWLFWVGQLFFAPVALQACVYYDEAQKCGPNMTFSEEAHVCLCDSRSIAVPGGCERCPSGSVPMGGKCECPAGTVESESGECQKITGLGDDCDAEHACTHDVYDYCAIKPDSDSGKCTKKCATDDDCDSASTCADWAETPYCQAFPSSGLTCSMPGADDPVCGDDADLCFMGQCFARGCTPTPDHSKEECPKDRKCCDVSFLQIPDVSSACVRLDSAVCK